MRGYFINGFRWWSNLIRRVQGCRGAGVQGCRGAGVQGCRGAGVQGCRGAGVQGSISVGWAVGANGHSPLQNNGYQNNSSSGTAHPTPDDDAEFCSRVGSAQYRTLVIKIILHQALPTLLRLIYSELVRSEEFCRVGIAQYRTMVIKIILIQALPTLLRLNRNVF